MAAICGLRIESGKIYRSSFHTEKEDEEEKKNEEDQEKKQKSEMELEMKEKWKKSPVSWPLAAAIGMSC